MYLNLHRQPALENLERLNLGRLAIGAVAVVGSLRSRVLDDTIYFLPTGVKRRGRAQLVMVWKQLLQEPLDRNHNVHHT
jgi:hypothetical protein